MKKDKTCIKCGCTFDREKFNIYSSGYWSSYCKTCENLKSAENYKKNRVKIIERHSKWQKDNREKQRENVRRYRIKKNGTILQKELPEDAEERIEEVIRRGVKEKSKGCEVRKYYDEGEKR